MQKCALALDFHPGNTRTEHLGSWRNENQPTHPTSQADRHLYRYRSHSAPRSSASPDRRRAAAPSQPRVRAGWQHAGGARRVRRHALPQRHVGAGHGHVALAAPRRGGGSGVRLGAWGWGAGGCCCWGVGRHGDLWAPGLRRRVVWAVVLLGLWVLGAAIAVVHRNTDHG